MKTKKNESRLHVLFVLENYYPNIGGVETLFKSLAENLARNGHRVTILTTRLSLSDPPKEIQGNIAIHRYRFLNRYFFTLFAIFPVLKHARCCDLVHTTSYNAALPAYLGARLLGKKIVVTFHEVWASLWLTLPFMGWLPKRLHYLFEQMLLRLDFDRFVGVSGSTSESLRKAGVPAERVMTIYNGINYQDFTETDAATAPKKNSIFTYTYFGRLGMSKGLDILLEAARLFRQQCPDSRLKLIVPTQPAGFLKQILGDIEKKGLAGHVSILHHLTFGQLKMELASSDCTVIPSYSEGFCFAAAESIALGVPVVSSGRAALKEVVSGRFIEMEDMTPGALAAALQKARVGEWRQTPLKKFELSDTIAAYENLYFQLSSEPLTKRQL
ncbi:MAG: glycosyltransferase family 4 protein [Lewinellaceae bacterium]|nr:glycosyltransferase family 4 protein [Saprospiraceae bacterium]MCB9342034.1 glycosyltransferase family 4 protein [Lewinellaceae bacterium]